jgi:hypothetical protein
MERGDGIFATKFPKLDRHGRPLPGRNPQQTGARRRRSIQGEQAIVRRGRRRFKKACAEGFQFAVQRHAGHVCTDHRNGDLFCLRRRAERHEPRLRHAGRTERQLRIGMERTAERGEERVAPAGRQQRDAEWYAVRPHARRNRETGKIEQVDEIRVGA